MRDLAFSFVDGYSPRALVRPTGVGRALAQSSALSSAQDRPNADTRAMTSLLMYGELAPWFHLFTPPEEYAGEAAAILALLQEHVDGPLETLLELGSGGGNTASHLRREIHLTLSDLSSAMLELSQTINPDVEHIAGDMRTLRLGRVFDAVLIHDAICYMTTEADLLAAFTTAFEHLRPGGVAVFEPDHIGDTFEPGTDHGGEDETQHADGRPVRALRYLEWVSDPDPTDTTYQVDYALLLRHLDGSVEMRQDRHTEGLFSKATWLQLLATAGFDAETREDAWDRTVFMGVRRAAGSAAR
jgi:SAM-dependent methyltransferase